MGHERLVMGQEGLVMGQEGSMVPRVPPRDTQLHAVATTLWKRVISPQLHCSSALPSDEFL